MRYPPLLVSSRDGAELTTARGRIIDFTAGDLFGIASHPHVRAAAHAAIERFGVSSVSAAERGGYTEIHRSVEEAIAKKLLAERAMLFPSRSQAIISLVSAGLNARGGAVLVDSSVSSPVLDACHLAELTAQRVDLRAGSLSGAANSGPGLLVIEGVSKVGLHIPNISNILHKLAVPLIADESFAFGITGLLGMGNFPPPVLVNLPQVRVLSFEASLGFSCCAVLGAKSFVEELCSSSRQRAAEIGVSALEAAAIGPGIELLDQMASWRDSLAIRSAEVIAQLTEQGVSLGSDMPLPFISISLGSAKLGSEFCGGMLARGYLVDYIGALTALSPVCSVRVVVSAQHSEPQIDGFVKAALEVWKRISVR